MPSIFDIKEDQIESLGDKQLTELLKKLLNVESVQFKIPLSSITISTEIRTADGGEDARVKWEGDPERTDWIPNKLTSFQIKATPMGIADCSNEVKNSQGNDLKPKVKDVFEWGGYYIMFLNKNKLNPKQIDERIQAIRDTLRQLGKEYADTAKIEIYDVNKITSWVNCYPTVISFVQTEMLSVNYYAFISWEKWERKVKDIFGTKFISNDGIESTITQIKASIESYGGKNRIIGLSGLGKTRIIFELFNSSKELQHLLVYTNTNDFTEENILSGIRELYKNLNECIIVVDNCSLKLHRRILDVIKGSGHRLITINYDLSNLSEEADSIVLNPEKFVEIIPKMLNEIFPGIPESDAKKISDFSMGFPLVAELLAKDRRSGNINLGKINDNELINRLIGINDGIDTEKKYVLMACSIFDKIGFEEEYASQRIAISKHPIISRLNYNEGQAEQKFYEYCQKYIEVGILEKVGRFVFVKPKPLALRLAEEWWKYCPPESVPSILTYLDSFGLSEALCDQIAKLDFLPKAQEVTADLCGETGPFGNAEVLNSLQGSRLFRSLVEVNPQATTDTLYRLYHEKPLDTIRQVINGRRNLVWALEKLCFWDYTFDRSSKILLAFAAAENEKMISNNATGQFLQLFQILLPGTRATLVQRQNLIDFALSKKELYQLGISALSRSLQTDHFSRMGGVESQGSRSTLMDYQPTFKEGIDYWKASVSKLDRILLDDPDNRMVAKEILLQRLAGIVRNNCFSIISSSIYKILIVLPDSQIEVHKAAEKALAYSNKSLTEVDREELEKLIQYSKPITFLDRYKTQVATPEYNYTTLKSFDEHVSENSKNLALEFIMSDYKWKDYAINFYKNDQQGGFIFGNEIGILINKDEKQVKTIISESLFILKGISRAERNINVLKGLINSIDNYDLRKIFIDEILNDPEVNYLLVEILSAIKPKIEELFLLFKLVDSGRIKIQNLAHFKYGRSLYHLSSDDVLLFCNKISTYQAEGLWTSLAIIFMYCYKNEERFELCKSFIQDILFTPDLILLESSLDAMDISYWETFSQKLLNNGEVKYADHISQEIIKYIKSVNKRNIDTEVKNIILLLIERYFEIFWGYLSEVIISSELDFFKLQYLIGSRIGSPGEEIGILFKGDLDIILRWCRENTPLAPQRIVRLTPIFYKSHGKVTWHTFTRTLIDEFGDIVDFMRDLDINFSSFTWSGSLVPLIEMKISLVNELLEHKFERVRDWSSYKLDKLKQELKYERFEDEEHQFI